MKYIRIQDGRIIDIQKLLDKAKKDEINLTDDERKIIDCIQTDNYNCMGWKRRVVKQADTIEELCDHLVVIEKGSSILPHIQYRFLGDLFLHRSYDEKFQQNKLIVYGAIWTDKGLIYVAKMNDKGEFELI